MRVPYIDRKADELCSTTGNFRQNSRAFNVFNRLSIDVISALDNWHFAGCSKVLSSPGTVPIRLSKRIDTLHHGMRSKNRVRNLRDPPEFGILDICARPRWTQVQLKRSRGIAFLQTSAGCSGSQKWTAAAIICTAHVRKQRSIVID
jgi:hypothetical protein